MHGCDGYNNGTWLIKGVVFSRGERGKSKKSRIGKKCTDNGASNASSYVKCNVEYKWWGENYGEDECRSATQERPEGFWQAARRDLEGRHCRDPTHCSPHCFSSRATLSLNRGTLPPQEKHTRPKVFRRREVGEGNGGRGKFGVFDDKWLDGDKLSLFPRDAVVKSIFAILSSRWCSSTE